MNECFILQMEIRHMIVKLLMNVSNVTWHLSRCRGCNGVSVTRTSSHLVVELRALIVVQDGRVGAAGKDRVSRLPVDALKGKQAHQSSSSFPFDAGARRWVSAQKSVITDNI